MPFLFVCRIALLYGVFLASTMLATPLFAQHDGTLNLSTDGLGQGLDLSDTLWRYHPGDDRIWADPAFNDAEWSVVVSNFDPDSLTEARWPGIGWFRLHLRLDSTLRNTTLALSIYHLGASEIYLDGQRIGGFGTIGTTKEEDMLFSPKGLPLGLHLGDQEEHVLAVRYANRNLSRAGLHHLKGNRLHPVGFEMVLNPLNTGVHSYVFGATTYHATGWILGILFLLACLHLLLYTFDRREQANLYFGLFALCCATTFYLAGLMEHATLISTANVPGVVLFFRASLAGIILFLLATLYALFYNRLLWFIWVALLIATGEFLLNFFETGYSSIMPLGSTLLFLEALRVIGQALLKKKDDAWILAAGLLTMGLAILIILFAFQPGGRIGVLETPASGSLAHLLLSMFYLSIPMAMSVLLARRFTRRSQRLERELERVEELSAQTLAQEREKQTLITSQNERLEAEVTARTEELRQSLANLKTTQAQLVQQEKMASLGQLTAGIAHEIKNPLNFVNNFAEIVGEMVEELGDELEARQQDIPADVNHNFKEILADLRVNSANIEKHGKRADGIVHAMMQHASGGSGHREPVDVNHLVSEHLDLAYHGKRAQNPELQVVIERSLRDDVGNLGMVPQEIGRVLLNLLGNAFDAVQEKVDTGSGGHRDVESVYVPTVSVSTHRVSDGVEIRVADNGPGIPPTLLKKIFEPFYTTKPTGSGTGLGLSLSYDIVTQGHGGTLTVESEEGHGATFIITLPG